MRRDDYPSLYRCSDAASRTCQRRYLYAVKAHLGLLAATGLIACWTPVSPRWDRAVSVSIALTMLAALIVGLVLKFAKLDDAWFRARAFAENAKNAAWRFMMTPAQTDHVELEKEEKAFVEELQKVRDRFPQVERHLSKHQDNGAEITSKMREMRTCPVQERLDFFKKHRLRDQIRWYMRKAKANANAEERWFWAILAADGLAVAAAVTRLVCSVDYNPTGGIAALAACLLAWTQTKRFSDLANTYGVAARDLNGIATLADHARDEAGLRRLGEEIEAAVSREHRLWVERANLTA